MVKVNRRLDMLIPTNNGKYVLTQHISGKVFIREFGTRQAALTMREEINKKLAELKKRHQKECADFMSTVVDWDREMEDFPI